jgi:hypothetical protein
MIISLMTSRNRTTIFSCPSARGQITPPTSTPSLLPVSPRTRSTHHAHTALLNSISIIILAAESFLVNHDLYNGSMSSDQPLSSYQLYALEWSTSIGILDETCTWISCFPQVYQVHLDQSHYNSRWTTHATMLSACNFRTVVPYGYRQGW